MAEVIRPSLPSVDAPRPRLVARVFDLVRRTDPRVARYRLKKALTTGADTETLRKAASALTSDERREVLEEIDREQTLAKSAAMPADPSRKVNWAAGFAVRWNRWHPRPEQAQAPAPARVEPTVIGDGKVRRTYRPSRGAVVHFTEGDTLRHGKIADWGNAGAIVVTPDGEFQVDWSALSEGVHPSAQAEYAEHVEKSQARDRDREWRETTRLLTMNPEERARYFERRGGF